MIYLWWYYPQLSYILITILGKEKGLWDCAQSPFGSRWQGNSASLRDSHALRRTSELVDLRAGYANLRLLRKPTWIWVPTSKKATKTQVFVAFFGSEWLDSEPNVRQSVIKFDFLANAHVLANASICVARIIKFRWKRKRSTFSTSFPFWSEWLDSNQRLLGPEQIRHRFLTTFINFLMLFSPKTMLSDALVRTVST